MYTLWNPKSNLLIKIIFFVIVLPYDVISAGNFTPEGRAGQEAVLIGTQLYFMGGSRTIPSSNPIKSRIREYNLSDEVFFLDLLSTFSTNDPPFVDLSGTGARMKFGNEKGKQLIIMVYILGGPSKEDAYLIGGTQQDLALLNKIDQNITITSNQTLMIEEIFKTYNPTDQMIFIYRHTARDWRQLGQGVVGTQPTRLNAPSVRSHAAPILLPDGKILYIGGVTQPAPGMNTTLLSMTE
ncbi:3485_t:CDS:2, partial [Racocetra fulgida]